VKKLTKKKQNYASSLKKAKKLSDNTMFQNCINKFTKLAVLFSLMQFREVNKQIMGRRFTQEEKIMALSMYKQGPRAYRWLSKIFILPSAITLSRLLASAELRPGINKKIFREIKKRVQKMSSDEKLCMVLFDEIAISPNFYYNRRMDMINGFVSDGIDRQKKIADHALVFMLRGVIKNYKQPISYTFCCGTTPKVVLKSLLKNIITELQNCGLHVLATVCDQGTTNVSAINDLIKETKESYLINNIKYTKQTFEVNDKEIIPLFDPPHLIKGIRNNLLTKDLVCVIDNERKTAKWEHIIQLYDENPSYKGIRLIKNLTEIHVNPRKICKMKVKYATQVFSTSVATNMGYLAGKLLFCPVTN
jgi:DNA transposase THAP9